MTQDVKITVDTSALRHNVAVLREAVAPHAVMVVVKANAYGHGAVESARAFVDAGVDWLGVADLEEALELRRAGITAPILAWLHAPGETFESAAAHDVTPAVSDLAQLEAAAAAGVRAVHLCVDTGLSRNGAVETEWPAFFRRAAELADRLPIEGLMSHLSNASPEEDGRQAAAFVRATGVLGGLGVEPRLLHLAASAAGLSYPGTRYGLVRFGLAAYGLSPFAGRSAAEWGLRPALALSAPVTTVKRVPAGEGVSYGYVFRPERDTTIAVVPVGYSDGVDRAASDRASVTIGSRTYRVRGRIAMNALVIDVGDDPVEVGDDVVLFGDPAAGHQGAADWATASGGITYETVACLSGALTRRYV
ncbi:alanine racemase [Frigoribacterium sp. CFBP9039]|uniref:alanine racemase n=1 Tax=Frigoribacterium TaxID=96492 RepID=UPI001783DBED|nr:MULTISPECIES: alanine racemase [Frigoribacterium]MBD8704204.1 alanine racemase [Frigoribacterium sp. CFBP 13712]MCJ0700425.1 alanine racemase [Frigoribacterium faeni]MDY0892610.1 alanine racemase [Frigoribacterium sp. CFBP9030]MDY0945465.1 alanine racemase [Frigoribacterium sp. CFBP9039]